MNSVPTKLNDKVEVVVPAIGADRLYADDSARWLTAELTAWRADEYSNPAEVPPVLRTWDRTGREADVVVNGWRLTGPAADGSVTFLSENRQEYDYRVANSRAPDVAKSLAVPTGLWVFCGAVAAGRYGVVVLAESNPRTQSWWIASIDPSTLEIAASARRAVAIARTNRDQHLTGIAGAHGKPVVLVLSGWGATWSVEALDVSTMATLWSTVVPMPATDPQRGAPWFNSGLVAIAGDDKRAMVGLGRDEGIGISLSHGLIVDMSTGQVAVTMDWQALATISGVAAGWSPIPGDGSVALLRRHSVHEPTDTNFAGVSLIDLTTGALTTVLDVSAGVLGTRFEQVKALDPAAVVAVLKGEMLIAPASEAAVIGLGSLPAQHRTLDTNGNGRERAAVRGLVTTSKDWHNQQRLRVGRPRMQSAHDEQ